MLFNRKIQISFVKDDKKANETLPEKTPVDYVAIATEIGKKVVIGTCVVLAVNVALMTAATIAVDAFNNRNEE